MKLRRTAALVCYVLVVLLALSFAGLYLLRSEFMPYHAVAVGTSWADLSPRYQALFLALMRVGGGGWLAVAGAIAILLLIPFRRNERWAFWAVPLIGLFAAVPTLYATLLVKARTPASPPWFGAAAAIALLVLGFVLSVPRRKGQSPGPDH